MCCDIVLKKPAVEEILKTTAQAMVELNINKNLVGSALAGCIGNHGKLLHGTFLINSMTIAVGNDLFTVSIVPNSEDGLGKFGTQPILLHTSRIVHHKTLKFTRFRG